MSESDQPRTPSTPDSTSSASATAAPPRDQDPGLDRATTDDSDGMRLPELAAAILLGLAAVLTAYAAWQGAKAGGDAVEAYLESNKLTTEAADQNGLGDQQDATNQALFLEYIVAEHAGNVEVAEFVLTGLMNEEAQETVAAWVELPDEESPPTPFHEDNPGYVNSAYVDAEALTEEAEAKFTVAGDLDAKGDKFDVSTVFLAVTLFFAGIATLFRENRIQWALLASAAVLLVVGVISLGIAQSA